MVCTLRTSSMPGVSRSITNIDARSYGDPSGSVTTMASTKSASQAPDANHLCPSITYSSPSSRAEVVICVGSDPAE